MARFVAAIGLLGLVSVASSKPADPAAGFVGRRSAAELVAAFNAWIDQHGGAEWSAIQVEEIPGFRLGTVARRHIKAEELYLAVPWKMLINEESIVSSTWGQRFLRLKQEANLDLGHFLLFFMLHQLHIADSFWKPYPHIDPCVHVKGMCQDACAYTRAWLTCHAPLGHPCRF